MLTENHERILRHFMTTPMTNPKIAEELEKMCLEARTDTLLVLIRKLAESKLNDQSNEAKAFNEGLNKAIDFCHDLIQVIQDMKK